MSAGRRNCLVTVQRKTSDRDTDGGERVAWTTVNTYWVSIEPLKGTEALGAAQMQSQVTGKMKFLYPADVTAADRVTYEGKTYNVEAVFQSVQHREITAMVSEGINDGR